MTTNTTTTAPDTNTPEGRKAARKAVATAGQFWIPTRPYTLVDAVNRRAAATGSVRYAQLSRNADYNGHFVTVSYNDYRGYSICEHYYGERVVHARGDMKTALLAGRREYDLGHRGTSVVTDNLTPDEAAYAASLGYVPWSKETQEAWHATWVTDLFACVSVALSDRGGPDTVHLLLASTNVADYYERRERAHADQMFGTGKWKECRITGPKGERGMVLSGKHARDNREYAVVTIDGKHHLSGPTDSARVWWKNCLAAGWTVAPESKS